MGVHIRVSLRYREKQEQLKHLMRLHRLKTVFKELLAKPFSVTLVRIIHSSTNPFYLIIYHRMLAVYMVTVIIFEIRIFIRLKLLNENPTIKIKLFLM